jgi:L-amino acid N-acyltransferase
MRFDLQPSASGDREAMADIFNYYVEHSFATYTENLVTPEKVGGLMALSEGWPALTARDEEGYIVGFGLLRPYSPLPAFSRTAEISYFIRPGYTGKGIGSAILAELEEGARGMGIESILATVCSLNEESIGFHLACGFLECGCLPAIGRKHGVTFDQVLLLKKL